MPIKFFISHYLLGQSWVCSIESLMDVRSAARPFSIRNACEEKHRSSDE